MQPDDTHPETPVGAGGPPREGLPPLGDRSHARGDQAGACLFARIGAGPFESLAAGLYARIDRDARLRAMFPDDLGPRSESVRDMREFLVQFFGGPADYSLRKGHPRLRARHMRFPIDLPARDAWLENALAALSETCERHRLDAAARDEIAAYLVHASRFMINHGGAGSS